MPWALLLFLFKKKETVTGNMAYRQGCSTEMNPQRNPSIKVPGRDLGTTFNWLAVSDCAKTKRAEMLNKAVSKIFSLFIQAR